MSTIMEENEEPASPTARMMQVPGFDICIYAIMGYSTLIDLDLFKSDLLQTLVKHPRFSSLLVAKDKKGGKYSWKRTIVDIEKHVFAPDLDPDMESPDEFVENFISRLSREKLDPAKPLWEMHVLNVKTSSANSTVIFKIDHSIGDGVSLISFILACAKKTSNPESAPVMPSKKPKVKIDRDKNNFGLLMTMKKLFSSVWIIFLVFYYTLIDLLVFLATILFFKDTKTPIKGAKGVENSPKRFVHRIVDLDDVKLVKNAMNATINDVLLGAAEAGLSRYLNMRYNDKKNVENVADVITKKKRTTYLPKNLRFRSAMTYNLRPSPTVDELIEVMDGKKELTGMWGNLVAFILVPLTIYLQKDPLDHIRRSKATMDRKKLSLQPNCVFMILKLIIKLFGTKVAAKITSRIFYSTTVTVSNVMGPQKDIVLYGHPLSYIAPTVSGFPQALIIHYKSYAKKLIISIAADEELVPNPHQLCDELHNSLLNFKETVIKKGLAKDASQLC
ncbi:hypothetical protein ACP275_06G022200 [Erythranthe tilingii]